MWATKRSTTSKAMRTTLPCWQTKRAAVAAPVKVAADPVEEDLEEQGLVAPVAVDLPRSPLKAALPWKVTTQPEAHQLQVVRPQPLQVVDHRWGFPASNTAGLLREHLRLRRS